MDELKLRRYVFPLLDLPNEIISMILARMPAKELSALRVNKKIDALCYGNAQDPMVMTLTTISTYSELTIGWTQGAVRRSYSIQSSMKKIMERLRRERGIVEYNTAEFEFSRPNPFHALLVEMFSGTL
ncbi:hypothetical protein PFISCL1PPCAC_21473, partial [Pristionchus fissidentatus]